MATPVIASNRRIAQQTISSGQHRMGGAHHAMYIGRVGALAVALGIGTALTSASVAYADTGASASSASSDRSAKSAGATSSDQSSRQSANANSRNRSSSVKRGPTAAPNSVSQLPNSAATTPKLTETVSIAEVQAAVASPSTTSRTTTSSKVTVPTAAAMTVSQPAAATAVSTTASKAAVTQTVSSATTVTASASAAKTNPFANLIAGLISALTGGSAAATNSNSSSNSSAQQVANAAATAATGTGGATNTTVEGETLTVTPSKAAAKVADNAASGRKALKLATNGTASTTITVPDFASVVVRARGDQFAGAPTMVVSVDGKVVATTQVTSTAWTDYTIPVTGLAGKHTISVAYTNDLSLGIFGDRNLYIDKLTVVAAPVVTDPPTTDPGDSQEPPFFGDADWLWNEIDSDAKTAANSATWVKYLSEKGTAHPALLYQYAVTIVHANQITATTPRYDVKFTQKWGADPFGTSTVALPKGTRVPPGSDGHVVVMDEANNAVYGFWQAKYSSSTDSWSSSWGGKASMSGNGIDTSGSATAAGISRAAGVITVSEFAAAVAANTGVNHALAFSSDIAGIDFVGPAIKSDGQNKAGVTTPMPEGYRIQLDPSIDVDAIPGITAAEKVIAKTLQTYGAYLVDQGGSRMSFAFEMASDATANNPGSVYTKAGLGWDYYDMAKIPWGSLRVLAA